MEGITRRMPLLRHRKWTICFGVLTLGRFFLDPMEQRRPLLA